MRVVRALLVVSGLLLAMIPLREADAALPHRNLVRNGTFEKNTGTFDGSTQVIPSGWTVRDEPPTLINYGAPGYPSQQTAIDIGGSRNFWAGSGPFGDPSAQITQRIAIPSSAFSAIDHGNVQITASALLGGYLTQQDQAIVSVNFLNGRRAVISGFQVDGPNASNRSNATTLLMRAGTSAVPRRTRYFDVFVTAIRADVTPGSTSPNDGYADNVRLEFGEFPSVTRTLTVSTAGAAMGGVLGAGYAPCRTTQTVKIYRVRRGTDRLVATVTTDGNGNWSSPTFASGRYYALAPKSTSGWPCLGARSPVIPN